MSKKIYVAQSKIIKAGRGVFALKDIKKNAVIEVCPILVMSAKDDEHILNTMLKEYVYEHNETGSLLALGYGSLYNHKSSPNAKYELVENEETPGHNAELYITAIRAIAKDEEICISYGDHFNSKYGV